MDIKRYERDGQVWECGRSAYVRYAGEPCVQLDMRGDPDGFFGDDAIIIEVADIGDGWMRYWYQSEDTELQASTAELTRLYEYGRLRGWND